MRRFFLLVAAIALMVACTESSTDNENNTPNTPQPEKSEISLDATSANFTAEGGEKKILFSTNEAWTAEIVNDRADGWLSISPTSGAAGNATLTVAAEPNDTPDERTASVRIKAGTAQKTINVSQKQKDALTVTSSKFEVGAEGGEVKIEVKANIDFEYTIDSKAQEWISYEGTRAMKTSTLTFSVAENDDTEKREGKIYIQSGEFNEEVTIYQAGAEPSIVISQNEYVVAADGETIAIDVTSNVDVTVELPANVDWISESTTRATSTNTYCFDIQPNLEYEQRTAEVKFTNNENGLSEVVTLTQKNKYVLLGTGYWVDDIVAPVFGIAIPTYPVEICHIPDLEDVIYVKDVYTNAYRQTLIDDFGVNAEKLPAKWETSYLEINIEEPDKVHIALQSIVLDLGYGEMYIGSLNDVYGKFRNGVISFPQKGLALRDGTGDFYANKSGKARLYMPDIPITDYTLEVAYMDFSEAEDKGLYYPTMRATAGADVAEIQYAFLTGNITDEDALAEALEGIKSGAITSEKVAFSPDKSEGETLMMEFESAIALEAGVYTIIAIPCSATGEAQHEDMAYTSFYLQGEQEAPEVDLELKLMPFSEAFPEYSDTYPDASTWFCWIYGSEIKSIKYILAPTERINEFLDKGYTHQDIVEANGYEFNPQDINADGKDFIYATGLKATTSYTLIVWAENIYGKTAIRSISGTPAVNE